VFDITVSMLQSGAVSPPSDPGQSPGLGRSFLHIRLNPKAH